MADRPTIVHAPHGLDAPYHIRPEERRPRDPVGGDMVEVGFLTRPGGAAREVRLHWLRNSRVQTPVLARAVTTGTDDDHWLVELGVLEAGDLIEYWIEVESAGERSTSPRHRFGVRRWRRLAGVTGVEPGEAQLHLMTLGDDGAPGPILTVDAAVAPRTVQFRVSPDTRGTPPLPRPNGPATLAPHQIEVPLPDPALIIDAASGSISLRPPTGRAIGPLTLRWLEEADGTLAGFELLGPLGSDEVLVGFGERFDALNQRGRTPDATVYEQYKNQGNRTYLPVPFFLSSQGYGCLVKGTARVSYDLGRTAHDRWRCFAHGPKGRPATLDLFVGSPAEVLRAYAEVVGRPAPPPAWAFGPWMSSNEWNTQARVAAEVEQTRTLGIPATALVIEAWSDETTFYVWNGARYAPTDGKAPLHLSDYTFPPDGPWPDPKGMVDALHEADIRLILWQIPALKTTDAPHAQHGADIAHAVERGYVLRDGDDRPYRNPAFWFHDALIPDFTHPDATAWWLAKRAYLLDELGVDGFKTDGGEHLQGRGILAHDGRRGDELVNAYPNLYVGAYHRFVRDRRGGDALTFSRAGHTGAGAFPAHWAGDENSTWEAFRRSIIAGLSAGLSGIPFWGWDLAGFSDALPSAELYLRAAAMAAFCPIMQYHSEYNPGGPSRDRTPWNVARHTGDDQVVPLYRLFTRLRMNLLPYVVSEAAHCAATGEPLMRALLLDDPDDPQAWGIQDQYRFGRDLLVAPVVDEGATSRRLYLPAGTWHDLWSDAVEDGGRWINVTVPLDRIPTYVRSGAVLPLNLGEPGVLGDDVGNAVDRYSTLTFQLYPADDTEYDWVDAAGERRRIGVERTDAGAVTVALPPMPVPCRLVIPGRASVAVTMSPTTRRITLT